MMVDDIPGEISGEVSNGGIKSSIPFTIRKARASQNESTSFQNGLVKLPRERSALSLHFNADRQTRAHERLT